MDVKGSTALSERLARGGGIVVELTESELALLLTVVTREARTELERHDRMIARPAGSHAPETIENARVTAGLYADLRDRLAAL